ncbi:MAG: energy-coupling factor transporter ATPase [Methanolobus sp.]
MIRIRNLTYSYPGGNKTLDSVSLDINKGEFVVITGKNGSGKTTLLRHMNGLLLPEGGSVSVNGMNTTDQSSILKIRQIAGMVFQDPRSQFIGMTVEEDVAFGPENLGLLPEEILTRVNSSLQAVGMQEYRNYSPSSLSGGQKQKVALASVIAMKPEILLFDEATSMLDPVSRKEILGIIRKLHEKGTTVVYVTHRLEELIHADRLIVIEGGQITHDDSPRKILAQAKNVNFGFPLPPVLELSRSFCESGLINPESFPLSREELREVLCQLM